MCAFYSLYTFSGKYQTANCTNTTASCSVKLNSMNGLYGKNCTPTLECSLCGCNGNGQQLRADSWFCRNKKWRGGGRFACCTHLKSSHFERAAHLEPLVPSNNVTSSAGMYDSTEKEITHLFLGWWSCTLDSSFCVSQSVRHVLSLWRMDSACSGDDFMRRRWARHGQQPWNLLLLLFIWGGSCCHGLQ